MRTRHWVMILIIIAALSWSSPAKAQENGTLRGRVINGTEGGGPVAGLEAKLTAYRADGDETTRTAQADTEGGFRFDGLSTAQGTVYQVAVDYQGATSRSEALSFAAGQDELIAEVVVYEATESDVALRIQRAHLVVELASDGFAMTEMLLIRNQSDGTYVGSGPEVQPGKMATLRFPLPPGAELVNIGESLMRCCIAATDDGFVDTMPVMPGTRVVLYVYTVPYSENVPELRRAYAYPVDRLDVFLPDGVAEMDVTGLSQAGTVQGRDSSYARWTGGGLAAKEQVVIHLEGLPFQGEAETSRAAATRKTAGWLLVTAAAVPLALIYPLWQRWQARSEMAKAEAGVDETRESLLQRVADLDDAFGAGEISEADYQVERAVLKQRLLVLWDQDAAVERESDLSGNDGL